MMNRVALKNLLFAFFLLSMTCCSTSAPLPVSPNNARPNKIGGAASGTSDLSTATNEDPSSLPAATQPKKRERLDTKLIKHLEEVFKMKLTAEQKTDVSRASIQRRVKQRLADEDFAAQVANALGVTTDQLKSGINDWKQNSHAKGNVAPQDTKH